jgi:hypothetical protein
MSFLNYTLTALISVFSSELIAHVSYNAVLTVFSSVFTVLTSLFNSVLMINCSVASMVFASVFDLSSNPTSDRKL